jgi:hypothetical protein
MLTLLRDPLGLQIRMGFEPARSRHFVRQTRLRTPPENQGHQQQEAAMPLSQRSTSPRGVVVAHAPGRGYGSEHERLTQLEFARRLAALKGCDFGGLHEPSKHYPGDVYFVPNSTLTAAEAAAIGVRGPDDLFGGVVPHAFVATKAISHPLIAPDAAAPPGWNPGYQAQVGDAVLAGYTVFSHDDARRAGLRLLADGPLRIKPVRATGGAGQSVARDAAELQRRLDAMDPGEVASHGLVLEENLGEIQTFSAGQVTVGDLTATYYGVQRSARNNRGEEVYGGSDLTFVRGGFEALLKLDCGIDIRRAVEQALRYDAAVRACFPGFFASRTNYDIALGRDAAGRPRSGVLEQSWRVGGATGPEIASLEVFRAQPATNRVRAACVEIYGDSPPPPPRATVYFRGTDPKVGRLTKYTLIEPDVHAR